MQFKPLTQTRNEYEQVGKNNDASFTDRRLVGFLFVSYRENGGFSVIEAGSRHDSNAYLGPTFRLQIM